MAAQTQDSDSYGINIPDSAWAEPCRWAADALNRSAATTSAGKRWLGEISSGEVPEPRLFPFSQARIVRVVFDSVCTTGRDRARPQNCEECFEFGM